MQVLLVDNYPALGYVGDTIQVKKGYGRNFLIPKGIAVEVGSRRAREVQHLIAGVNAKRARLKSEAEELGKKISGERLSFELKVGANGKAFGSVSVRDVLGQINGLGYDFQRKQVRLSDVIKAPGDYTASVQLHSEVVVEFPISVAGIKEKAPDEPRGKKGRRRKADDAVSEDVEAGGEGLEASEVGAFEEALRSEDAAAGEEDGSEDASPEKEE